MAAAVRSVNAVSDCQPKENLNRQGGRRIENTPGKINYEGDHADHQQVPFHPMHVG